MSWDTICDQIDDYAQFAAPVAASVRPHMVPVHCLRVYAHPVIRKIAFNQETNAPPEFLRKLAKHACLPCQPIPVSHREAMDCGWIKVAESKTLRSGLEALQFLPSTSSMPNAPSPLAAMLASGLVGAGVGYGAGSLLSMATPEAWNRKRLRRNSALLGGLAATTPALIWAFANRANDKGITDPWPNAIEPVPPLEKVGEDTVGFMGVPPRQPGPADVNVNALGQVLWNNQAPAPMTAATLGTMHTADQFPDPTAPEGWVTAHQLGQLAMAAGQGYVMGTIVGKALNIATGMPTRYGSNAGAALGIINLALPRLFG